MEELAEAFRWLVVRRQLQGILPFPDGKGPLTIDEAEGLLANMTDFLDDVEANLVEINAKLDRYSKRS